MDEDEKVHNESLQQKDQSLSLVDLPEDLVARVFDYLDLVDLRNCLLVCSAWRDLLQRTFARRKHLSLRNSPTKPHMTQNAMQRLLQRCTSLDALDLTGCKAVSAHVLQTISVIRTLKRVNLSRSMSVTFSSHLPLSCCVI